VNVTYVPLPDGKFAILGLTGEFSGYANAVVDAGGTVVSATHFRPTGKTRQMTAGHKVRFETPVGLYICRAVREYLTRMKGGAA